MHTHSLYIHIPFCRRKCVYCDFVSYPQCEHLLDEYCACMAREMETYRGAKISTVFVGGGTPTLLSEQQIALLFENIRKHFSLCDDVEITMEANPETLTTEKMRVMKACGVNRISLGVQSFNEKTLLEMGRAYTKDEAIAAYHRAQHIGFENVGIDCILAWPTETVDDMKHSLAELAQLSPTHVSAYVLTVDEHTPLAQRINDGVYTVHDSDEEADFFETAIEVLKAQGYQHYEISNFCKPGYACKHNITYWHNDSYIGIGASAWSYVDGVRYQNPVTIDGYADMVRTHAYDTNRTRDVVVGTQKIAETIFLNLRMLDRGVSQKQLCERYGSDNIVVFEDVFSTLHRDGFLEIPDDTIRLTRKGMLLGNQVFAKFVNVQ